MAQNQIHDFRSTLHASLGRTPNDARQFIQVCSLGSSCGVKLTIQGLGLDEESLPFDWMRSSADGLMQWLQGGFHNYFQGPFTRFDITFRNAPMTVYRSSTHSFWHDDIEDVQIREKLWRRANRFNGLATDAKSSPGRSLLFVRTCCGTEEIVKMEALYEVLQHRFGCKGRRVYLLVIIEDQGMVGPILHAKYPTLMFWVQPIKSGPIFKNDAKGPYEDAVAFACRRMLQDPMALMPAAGKRWPEIQCTEEILAQGGILRNRGLRDSEAGLWCGMVHIKHANGPQMFCAFEGYTQREMALTAPMLAA